MTDVAKETVASAHNKANPYMSSQTVTSYQGLHRFNPDEVPALRGQVERGLTTNRDKTMAP